VVYVPQPQDLLATILNQPARPLPVHVTDHLVLDMTEDLPTNDINAEQVVMRIEPSSTDCGVEVGGNHVLSTDSEDCALEINFAMLDSEEEEDEELPSANWEGLTVEDYDRLYRLLHAEYKDFDKRHRSSQRKIHGLEVEIEDLHSRIKQLKGEIEDLKALDDEKLRELAKTEEVQALEASMRDLEGQLEFERGH
jgi:hypothetical protein